MARGCEAQPLRERVGVVGRGLSLCDSGTESRRVSLTDMSAYAALGNFQGTGSELMVDRLVEASARASGKSQQAPVQRDLVPWVGDAGDALGALATKPPPPAKCVARGAVVARAQPRLTRFASRLASTRAKKAPKLEAPGTPSAPARASAAAAGAAAGKRAAKPKAKARARPVALPIDQPVGCPVRSRPRPQAPATDAEQGADAESQRRVAEAFAAAAAAARAPRPPKAGAGAPKEAKEPRSKAKLVPLPPAPTASGDGSSPPKSGVARWAGPAFSMSPAPEALPMPSFSGSSLLSRSASTPTASSLLQPREPAAEAKPMPHTSSLQEIRAVTSEPVKPQQRMPPGQDASQQLRAMLNIPAAAAPPPQQMRPLMPQMQMPQQMLPPHMQMQPQQMMPSPHMQQIMHPMHGMPPHMQHMQHMMPPYGQPPYGQPPPNMAYRQMPPMPPMQPPLRPQQTPAAADKSAALRQMLGVS